MWERRDMSCIQNDNLDKHLANKLKNNTVMAKKLGMFTLYVAVLLKIE